jgi:FixJ family two-component response regulator
MAVRRALRDMLIDETDYAVIPFALEGDFLESLAFLPPGCILIESDPQARGQHTFLPMIAELRPELPIVALCTSCDVPTAVNLIKSGAIDVVDLDKHNADLPGVVRNAFAALPERVRRAELHRTARDRIAALTQRELAVLKLIAQGMLSKQIAHEMKLSVRTVEMHRSHILTRMNVRSMGDCVHLFHLAFREDAFDDIAMPGTAQSW